MATMAHRSAEVGGERTAGSRQVLVLLVIALSGLAGVQLFVLADATASYFAWTVNPPIAAAFLGAAFWGVALATLVAFRSGDWRELTLLIPVATVTTALVLVATLLHLDRFHLGVSDPIPLVAAWVWLAVYVIVPPLFALFWWAEWRRRGTRTASPTRTVAGVGGRSGVLPTWLRGAYAVLAVVVGLVALVLFVSPGTLPWAWTLTPLTSRMTGAFLAGLAAIGVAIAADGDLVRVRIGAIAVLAFGLMEILAVVRFNSQFAFGDVAGLGWLALLAAAIVLGAAVLARPSESRRV